MGSLPRDLNAQIKHMVHVVMRKEAEIAALQDEIHDLIWPISRDGTLRWPFSPVLQIIFSGSESEKVFLSQDFYTKEGHRMSAQLQLHRQWLSLFLKIKEGPDDDSIQWPFPYSKVNFQVRSHDGGEPWEKVYQVDHLDEKFSRPTEAENEKFGFDNFISLDNLLRPENKLIEGNTVSIMISVDE